MSSTERTEAGSPAAETKPAAIPTASAVLANGDLVEMVYDAVARKTQFVFGSGDAWSLEESVLASPTERLVPYSPTNNLVKHNVVLFPSEPSEYGDEMSLVAAIRTNRLTGRSRMNVHKNARVLKYGWWNSFGNTWMFQRTSN